MGVSTPPTLAEASAPKVENQPVPLVTFGEPTTLDTVPDVPQLSAPPAQTDDSSTTSPNSLTPPPQTAEILSVLTWPAPPDLPDIQNAQELLPESTLMRLVLRISDRRVYLYQGSAVEVSYPVAVGKQGWETPVGQYKVMQMIKDPTWKHPWEGFTIPPGPDNPLGDRWIGFWTDGKNFIGFHGTPNESLVGQAVSHGCVRMRNNDIRALFAQVEVGTPVIVEP